MLLREVLVKDLVTGDLDNLDVTERSPSNGSDWLTQLPEQILLLCLVG